MTDVKRPLSLQIGPTSAGAKSRPLASCSSSRVSTTVTGSASLANLSKSSPATVKLQPRTAKTKPSLSSSCSTTSSSSSGYGSPDTPSLILPYLYVGDQDQTQIDTISSLNIGYILSLQSLPKFLEPDLQLDTAEQPARKSVSQKSDSNQAAPGNRVRLSKQPSISTTSGNSETDSLGYKEIDNDMLIADFARAQQQQQQQAPSCLAAPTTIHRHHDVDVAMEPQDCDTGCDCEDETAGGQQREQLVKPCINLDLMSNSSDCTEGKQTIDPNRLLPSVNSSRDYLVKFKSCVNKLIRGKCINISDTFEQLVDRFFDETHSFIEEARRNKCNILVHCKAGVSRSPTIAIAYLMKWKRLHLQDAYDFVKRCRPQISPNLNFMGQLMKYERRLLQREFHRRRQSSPSLSYLPNPKRPASLPTSLDYLGAQSSDNSPVEEPAGWPEVVGNSRH